MLPRTWEDPEVRHVDLGGIAVRPYDPQNATNIDFTGMVSCCLPDQHLHGADVLAISCEL
jgi:hypothetical protein